MNLIKNTVVTFITRIAGVILGIVAISVIARVFGPEGKGDYSLLILIPALIVLVGNLGVGIGNTYYGGNGKHPWNQLVSNSVLTAILLGIVLIGLFLGYYFVFHPSFLNSIETRSVVIALAAVPFGLISNYFGSILLGQKRLGPYNIIQVVQNVSLLLFVVAAILAAENDITLLISAWVATQVVSAGFAGYFVFSVTPGGLRFYPAAFTETVRFGIKGYLGNVIQFLNYRLDMILVASFLTSAAVGFYSTAVNVAEALWYLPSAVATVIVSRTPGLTPGELNRSTPQVCRNTFFITTVCALGLVVLGRPAIILVFGVEYVPSFVPLLYLLPGVAALSISKVLGNEIAMRGKPMLNTINAGISLLVNITLNLLLIPRMGISGAALASSISYTVTTAIMLAYFIRISETTLAENLIVTPEDLKAYGSATRNVLGRVFRKTH